MDAQFIINVEAVIYGAVQKKYLMILRSDKEEHAAGTLSMVGGTVEYSDSNDNTLEFALQREVEEEIWVQLWNTFHYVESKTFVTNKWETVLDIVMIVEYISGTPTAKDPDEVADILWLSYDEIMSHEKTPRRIKQSIEKSDKILHVL